MGTNSKTAHKPGTIATGAPPQEPQAAAVSLDATIAVNDLVTHVGQHPSPADGEPLTDWYQALSEKALAAHSGIEAAKEAGADQEITDQLEDMMWLSVPVTLNGLPKDQLADLAAQHGFEHPMLAGVSEHPGEDAVNPLAHWLDPTFPSHGVSKLAIQNMAHDRYAKLCQGSTIGGLDLAGLHALEGTDPPGFTAAWTATPAEIDEARQELQTALHAVASGGPDLGTAVVTLLAAEKHLMTADCASLPELPAWKTAAAGHVSTALQQVPEEFLSEAIEAGQADGSITAAQASVLPPHAAVLLMRAGTPPDVSTGLAGLAASYNQQLDTLQAAHAKFSQFKPSAAVPLSLPSLAGDPHAAQQIADFAKTTGEYLTAHAKVATWSQSAPGLTGPDAAEWLQPSAAVSAEALSKEFTAWGKHQDTADLQPVAATLGMGHAEHASKVQALKYIASHWDPSADKAAIQFDVTAKSLTAAGSVPASAAEPAPAVLMKSLASELAGAQTGGFAAKHKRLVAALAHAKATAADLPPRLDAGTVASFSFGTGTDADLGGIHAKSVHDGPGGGQWLFKPDKQAKGARAHAEAAASALLHAGGVPSVPVYAVKIDGKAGSVQPLLKGAKQISSDPKKWTQAEVDSVVRYHVAAWLAGDHDGKPDNVLRTASGGLVPIDQGQAFKFYGNDKLDLSYHPNSTYGAERPVYQQLYETHLTGGLAPGVKINPAVAHPVIKAYEKMPDAQLRAILHDTAHQGAASGVVAWVPAMRARAAKQHGIAKSAVTTAQIADAFLDHACERKNGLRAAFANFLTHQVKLPAAVALHYGS